jgi:hypothetical protein
MARRDAAVVGLGEIEQLQDELARFVAEVFASVPRRDTRGWGDRYSRGLTLDVSAHVDPADGAAAAGWGHAVPAAVGEPVPVGSPGGAEGRGTQHGPED